MKADPLAVNVLVALKACTVALDAGERLNFDNVLGHGDTLVAFYDFNPSQRCLVPIIGFAVIWARRWRFPQASIFV